MLSRLQARLHCQPSVLLSAIPGGPNSRGYIQTIRPMVSWLHFVRKQNLGGHSCRPRLPRMAPSDRSGSGLDIGDLMRAMIE
jgi:hypothetical protein